MWKPLDVTDDEIATARRAFSRKARFLADESVNAETIDLLRSRGYNVLTAEDAGLRGRDDGDHFARAFQEDRILLTQDLDFLDDRRFPPHRNPGVVVLQPPQVAGQTVEAYLVLLTLIAPMRDAWRGAKIKITTAGEVTIWNHNSESGRREATRYRMRGAGPAEEWVP